MRNIQSLIKNISARHTLVRPDSLCKKGGMDGGVKEMYGTRRGDEGTRGHEPDVKGS